MSILPDVIRKQYTLVVGATTLDFLDVAKLQPIRVICDANISSTAVKLGELDDGVHHSPLTKAGTDYSLVIAVSKSTVIPAGDIRGLLGTLRLTFGTQQATADSVVTVLFLPAGLF